MLKIMPVMIIAATPLVVGAEETACRPQKENGPVRIDNQCVDTEFSKPVIDNEKDIISPVPLHHVSGHFAGTSVTFNFYFPPVTQWKHRFIHHLYPFTSGVPDEQTLRFGAESGAYIVKTGASSGYRADAAAAKFSRHVARQFYGKDNSRIYGYVYGGSGGSYQTIAAVENSQNVWDGAVPYVIGVPTSIPNNFFARAFARLVLRDVANQIQDAMSPGGSGDPYAGLDTVQRDALREITRLGVPLRGWQNPDYLLGLQTEDGLMGFQSSIKQLDPDYVYDFWNTPGYLGTEMSPTGNFIRKARIRETVQVVSSGTRKNVLTLAHLPSSTFIQGAEYTLFDHHGTPLGKTTGYLNESRKEVTLASDTPANLLARMKNVSSVLIDNSWPVALTTYHRHQVPKEAGYDAWNQFRLTNGQPVYPQRALEAGPLISNGASGGGKFTGKYTGKMIVLGNLLDMDAYPWQGDWYAQRVRAATGNNYDEKFRIWINDNADHHDGSVIVSGKSSSDNLLLVSYVGILQQAIRDVSAWVEKGQAPAKSTDYRITDGQVSLNPDATKRNGIQPAVRLTVAGQTRAEITAGEAVVLKGVITVPPGAGRITRIEWSKTGSDEPIAAAFTPEERELEITSPSFIYHKPGTYFPVLRVTLQRDGDTMSRVAWVQNMDRVRVVVR